MKTRSMNWMFTLLAALPAWAYTTPAHAQGRGGRFGGGNDAAAFAGQIMRGLNQGLQQQMQQRLYAPGPSQGGANLGGFNQGGFQQPRGYYLNPSSVGGFNQPTNFNAGGLSGAFGQPPRYQPQYQPPQYQAYQQPQYEAYQQPQYQPQQQASGGPNPGQPYQIPEPYAGYAAGTVITWGQYRYLLGSDGTMTLYTAPAQTSRVAANTQPTSGGPTPGMRYQIPAEHADTAPGTQITYAGYSYVTNNDGTMTAFNAPSESDSDAEQTPTGPVPGKRYQIPAEHATTSPGSVITYGGNTYVANDDGTMTAFTAPL